MIDSALISQYSCYYTPYYVWFNLIGMKRLVRLAMNTISDIVPVEKCQVQLSMPLKWEL